MAPSHEIEYKVSRGWAFRTGNRGSDLRHAGFFFLGCLVLTAASRWWALTERSGTDEPASASQFTLVAITVVLLVAIAVVLVVARASAARRDWSKPRATSSQAVEAGRTTTLYFDVSPLVDGAGPVELTARLNLVSQPMGGEFGEVAHRLHQDLTVTGTDEFRIAVPCPATVDRSSVSYLSVQVHIQVAAEHCRPIAFTVDLGRIRPRYDEPIRSAGLTGYDVLAPTRRKGDNTKQPVIEDDQERRDPKPAAALTSFDVLPPRRQRGLEPEPAETTPAVRPAVATPAPRRAADAQSKIKTYSMQDMRGHVATERRRAQRRQASSGTRIMLPSLNASGPPLTSEQRRQAKLRAKHPWFFAAEENQDRQPSGC